MSEKQKTPHAVEHPIPPVWDGESRILILGSFPSVKSRAVGFFYGHPQNRFWRVLSAVYNCEIPQNVDGKIAFLSAHGIALWDVIASCEITGSSDASIRNVVPTELEQILQNAPIERIFVNGKTAERYYQKYQAERLGRTSTVLPSTSPANAAWSLERLVEAWRVLKE